DAREERRPEDRQKGRHLLDREDLEERERQQVQRRDVELLVQRRERRVRARVPGGRRGESKNEEDDQADRERGPGGPEHVPDGPADRQAPADELRDEDRQL